MKYRVTHAGKIVEVEVELRSDGCVVRGPDAQTHRIVLETRPDGSQRAITPWGELELQSARRGEELWAHVGGRRLQARVERVRPAGNGTLAAGAGAVCAPMAGRLLRVDAKVGEQVRAGQPLAVIEAMKMENELLSPLDGVVTHVLFEPPQAVDKGALIVQVKPA
jgi:biotin carboxyl carrier protein